MRHRNGIPGGAGRLLLSLLWAPLAWAQEGATASAESIPVQSLESAAATPPAAEQALPPPTALETVVVTAQKREASLQNTPISLLAFDRRKLETLDIRGVADLASNVPAMTVDPFPTNNAQLRLFIRGIGLIDAQVTQDAAVGVYIDGIYIARSAGLALDVADLARVEVLRGPQGTLYGRNATGGAINLITRRPSTAGFASTESLSYGSRNALTMKADVNVPLSETLAVKLAAIRTERDGFVENTGPGGEFGDHQDLGLRFDARWQARAGLSLDYSYDRSDIGNYNALFQGVLPSSTTHGSADLFKAYAQSQTIYSSSRLDALATSAPLEESTTKISGHALTLGFDLGNYELKYIGAYRKLDDTTYSDLGGGLGSPNYRLDTGAYSGAAADMAYGGPTPLQIPRVFQDQWSHELQFGGKLFDQQLEFVSGLYAFEEEGGEDGRPLHHILNAVIDPSDQAGLPEPIASIVGSVAGASNPQLVALRDYLFRIRNQAQAFYTQATWTPAPLPRLHLTAGFRHSRDRRYAAKDSLSRSFIQLEQNGQGIAVELPESQGTENFAGISAASRYTDNSPSFNVQYELTETATVYASSARAYKSGGFNVRDPQISAESGAASDGTDYGFGFVEGFKPERVRSHELGLKSEWFGRRLRLNSDVFRSDYRDQQINFLIPGTVSDSKTRNAGRSRISGFELDATALPLPGLILGLSYAYLDARTLEVLDLDGNNVADRYPFVSAPRHSGNVSADWTFLKRGWGNLRGYLNYSYIGLRQGSASLADYRDGAQVPAYGLLTGQIGATAIKLGAKAQLDVALYGRNLLDKEYVVMAIDNTPQADRAVVFGEPRSVGLNLIYRYR
ncbi:MAG: TonB-dependent receptor [Stagnimonas sp.]|nr:TonB-dependent receptor [Stagnimonas sp.]